jgi:biopolymer transport protein ExbB
MQFLVQFFRDGGIWVWFILGVGVFSLAISLERFIYLYFSVSIDKDFFLGNLKKAILAGDLNSAVNFCNGRAAPMSYIIKAGVVTVMNKGKDEEIQSAMDVAALREVPKIEKRTPFLALLGNVATLIGLLSTIVGLIYAFEAVSSVEADKKAALLSRGISEAMNGTAMGLVVAIPTLLVSAVLTAKTQQILDDIHEASVTMLNLILQNRDKFPTR